MQTLNSHKYMPKRQVKASELTTADLVDDVEVIPEPPQDSTALAPLNKYDQLAATYQSYLTITINGIQDKAGYKKADAARKEVKKVKAEVENVRKGLVEPLNDMLNQINGRARDLKNQFLAVESHLAAEVDKYEAEQAAEQRRIIEEREEKIARRLDQILTIGASYNGVSAYKIGDISISLNEINNLSDEDFIFNTEAMELEASKIRQQQRLKEEQEEAQRKKDEEEREQFRLKQEALEKERAEFEAKKAQAEKDAAEAERKRMEREAQAKKEQERIATELLVTKRRLSIALFKLDEDKDVGVFSYRGHIVFGVSDFTSSTDEEWDSFISTLPDALAQTDADIEAEEKAAAEEKEKLVKEALEKAEKDRVEKEEADKAEKQRQEALKPDKEKLSEMADAIVNSVMPNLSTDEAKEILKWTQGEIKVLYKELKQKIKLL